jgi:hypothetical protein
MLHAEIRECYKTKRELRASLIAQYRALAASFGLDPSSRTRIHVSPKKQQKETGWEKLKNA